jgi:hypothetical protein
LKQVVHNDSVQAMAIPPPSSSCKLKISPNTWEEVAVKELMVKIAKICSDHKSEAEGGEGIGPAHQEKSITAARKAGKPCDTLVDDIVIKVQEPVKQSDKSDKGM